MKKTVSKFVLMIAALVFSNAALACDPGTYGIGVQGGSSDNAWVNVYAGNGQYNQTKEVTANNYEEFCWANNLGQASVTKTVDGKCSAYNWPVPDPSQGYKTIYIDSDNWGKSCG